MRCAWRRCDEAFHSIARCVHRPGNISSWAICRTLGRSSAYSAIRSRIARNSVSLLWYRTEGISERRACKVRFILVPASKATRAASRVSSRWSACTTYPNPGASPFPVTSKRCRAPLSDNTRWRPACVERSCSMFRPLSADSLHVPATVMTAGFSSARQIAGCSWLVLSGSTRKFEAP